MSKIRLMVVEDHHVVREGVVALLSSIDDIEVVASVDNGVKAVASYSVLRPDVTFMDLQLPEMGGVEALRKIRCRRSNTGSKGRLTARLRTPWVNRMVAFCKWMCCVVLLLAIPITRAESKSVWRAANAAELEAFLPARAAVEKERIETELRTATGITDGHGRTVAAVVLITAGYAAEGRYSHYLLTQSSLRLGDSLQLKPGAYVLGWTRTAAGLLVHLYDARTGAELGSVVAHPYTTKVRVEPLHIWPPGETNLIQIGRFFVNYRL